MAVAQGLRNEGRFRGANVLVSESEPYSDSDWGSEMMDGSKRGQEPRRKSSEGRAAKCVAVNRKNGMKRRRNVKRPESVELNSQGCITLKKRGRKDKGGSGRRMDTGTVLVFLVCARLLTLKIQAFSAKERERHRVGESIMKTVWDPGRISGDKREEME